MKVSLNQKILSRNDQIAQQNREFFAQNGILCLNVISSPGSGKTTLLAMLAGLLSPTAGEVLIGGGPPGGFSGAQRTPLRGRAAGFSCLFYTTDAADEPV